MRQIQISQKVISEPPFLLRFWNLHQNCNKKRYARNKWHGFHQTYGPTL